MGYLKKEKILWYSKNMIRDLPDDSDDDAPVKVAYHRAPVDEPEDTEPEDDPLDKEEPEEDLNTEPDPPEDDPPEEPVADRMPVTTGIQEADPNEYYLQTVKAGEQPEWEVSKDGLDVFSQPLDSGLMQYWAYHKGSGKTSDSVPNAEAVAVKNKSDYPVIIIDQVKKDVPPNLELVLARNGHALAKTESNLDNLESGVTSLIDNARMNFGITVEHFISTGNVSPEVERRLNDLEDGGDEPEAEQDNSAPLRDFQQASVYNQKPNSVIDQPILPPKNDRSKLAVLIPVIVLIAIGGTLFFYRDKVRSLLNRPKQEAVTPAPTETPTPTPTIAIDRSKFKVRVLNGTPKTGAAGVLADKLKEKGWTIDKTGNATSSAIARSTIRGKLDDDAAMKLLMTDVTDYEASISSDILKTSDKADLEFVIGKR